MLSLIFAWFFFFPHCTTVITHCLPGGSIISTLWLNFTLNSNLISETMLYTARTVTIRKIVMFATASELKRVRRCNKVATVWLQTSVVVFLFITEFVCGREYNYSTVYYAEAAHFPLLVSWTGQTDDDTQWLGILIVVWFHCDKKISLFLHIVCFYCKCQIDGRVRGLPCLHAKYDSVMHVSSCCHFLFGCKHSHFKRESLGVYSEVRLMC